jgi:hypothetical protein
MQTLHDEKEKMLTEKNGKDNSDWSSLGSIVLRTVNSERDDGKEWRESTYCTYCTVSAKKVHSNDKQGKQVLQILIISHKAVEC